MTKTSTLAAALWDFDGTLVDSEPLWLDAEFDLIADLGGTWSIDHADQLIGNSLLDSASYILNAIGRHDLSPAWVVDELIIRVIQALSARPIPWRPGARELLSSFAAAAIPCALVSARPLPQPWESTLASALFSRTRLPEPDPGMRPAPWSSPCRVGSRSHPLHAAVM